ncbi:hypothetical protein CALCODRAFT_25563 [Calocera cornea HHB12733]|uniref:Uncharacterized protein n=1 Tax=Calocera cornea HHB12733 TaxID=1353952 RepID=A0A165J2P4_9BASI|nr:hypothetical protein CALCODRAFT_25563 [Calocera cornea HHB12733]
MRDGDEQSREEEGKRRARRREGGGMGGHTAVLGAVWVRKGGRTVRPTERPAIHWLCSPARTRTRTRPVAPTIVLSGRRRALFAPAYSNTPFYFPLGNAHARTHQGAIHCPPPALLVDILPSLYEHRMLDAERRWSIARGPAPHALPPARGGAPTPPKHPTPHRPMAVLRPLPARSRAIVTLPPRLTSLSLRVSRAWALPSPDGAEHSGAWRPCAYHC